MKNVGGYGRGIISGIIAYVLWGIFPLYWKMLDSVGADEILAHRIIWCLVAMFFLTMLINSNSIVALTKEILTDKKLSFFLILASVLVTINWFIYIWAVNHNHIIDSSLGYYINPLINVLLGSLFLNEKMNRGQWISVGFATIGVVILTMEYGHIPYISLSLALSFSFYGLVKRNLPLTSNVSLFFETLLISPFAIGYLVYLWRNGSIVFGSGSLTQNGMLIFAGVITSLPLLFFGYSAQRIPFYMLGFMQYISPTIQLALGIFVYKEHFSTPQTISFALTWIGLIIFTISTTTNFKNRKKQSKKFSA